MKTYGLLVSIALLSGCLNEPSSQLDLSAGTYAFMMDATDIPDKETEHSETECTVTRDGTNLVVRLANGGAYLVGSLQEDQLFFNLHHEKPDPMVKAMQLRMVLEGEVQKEDYAVGTLNGYAGTNNYIKGTWVLKRKH